MKLDIDSKNVGNYLKLSQIFFLRLLFYHLLEQLDIV